MKNSLILIVVVLIVGGFYWLWTTSYMESEPLDNALSESSAVEVDSNPVIVEPVLEKTVTYTDAGFTPSSLEIKSGDTVKFENQSNNNVWVSSAKHPTHANYPTTGGCIGSTFDSCKALQKGEIWSFKFDIAGNWKYHNHVDATKFGEIVVVK